MSPLRQEIESLLTKDGWTLENRKKYTYAYKDDESERYRVGDRGLRKQKHTNIGWVNTGKLVPLSGIKEYLKGKAKGSDIIHGNPCKTGSPVKSNPLMGLVNLKQLAREVYESMLRDYGVERFTTITIADINTSVANLLTEGERYTEHPHQLHQDEWVLVRQMVFNFISRVIPG